MIDTLTRADKTEKAWSTQHTWHADGSGHRAPDHVPCGPAAVTEPLPILVRLLVEAHRREGAVQLGLRTSGRAHGTCGRARRRTACIRACESERANSGVECRHERLADPCVAGGRCCVRDSEHANTNAGPLPFAPRPYTRLQPLHSIWLYPRTRQLFSTLLLQKVCTSKLCSRVLSIG